MGIEDVVDELDIYSSTTVGELEDRYGEEVVRRALKYMDNLSEADENYRESADPDDMEEGYRRGFDIDEDEEINQEASNSWSEAMQDEGLGIDE